MEINGLNGAGGGTNRIGGGEKTPSRAERSSGPGRDCIMRLEVELAETAPVREARAARVEQLRAEIAAGSYDPDPVMVARKILGME